MLKKISEANCGLFNSQKKNNEKDSLISAQESKKGSNQKKKKVLRGYFTYLGELKTPQFPFEIS